MKKFVRLAFVVVVTAFAGYGVYFSQKKNLVSDLALANIMALASGEHDFNDYDEKVTNTWSEGPYKDGPRIYYRICTSTDCYGKGLVKCEFNLDSEIVYK